MAKGPETPKKSEAIATTRTPPSGSKKAPPQMPGGCLSWGCKHEAQRFGFCPEHYEHYKFGLVKKTGEPVPDYDKKYEHYLAYQARTGRKVA
jgi:hypothetical protein